MLDTEQNFYSSIKDHLLKYNQYKFIVIKHTDIIGIYVNYEIALNSGYHYCGVANPFLVKCIVRDENQYVNNILTINKTDMVPKLENFPRGTMIGYRDS